jgi:multidrug transporter EmrE-like cation transporter
MGMALSVWGLTGMATGWATGNFGLAGSDRAIEANPTLNYVGVAVAACAGVFFALVQPEPQVERPEQEQQLIKSQKPVRMGSSLSTISAVPYDHEPLGKGVPYKGGRSEYVLGFVGALLAGCFFGSMFDIATVMIQGAPSNGHSRQPLDYILPQTLGIVLFNGLVLLGYLSYKRFTGGEPYIACSVVLPAMISGAMWAVAFTSFNVANAALSSCIAYPIISTGPSVVSMTIGILCFGEYKTLANLAKIGVAFALAIGGVILISQSACRDVVSVAACPDGEECIYAPNAGVFRYCGDH